MSKIRIYGDTSGYIDVAAPAAADNSTLDLSTVAKTTGDQTFSGDVNVAWSDNNFIGMPFSDGSQFKMGMQPKSSQRDLQIVSQSNDGFGVSGVTVHTGSTLTERMRIDASGRVTMPYQPSFLVGFGATNTISLTDGSLIEFDNDSSGIAFDNGNNFDTSGGNHRFTVPVSGTYFFNLTVKCSTVGNFSGALKVNGSNSNIVDAPVGFSSSNDSCVTTLVMQLNTNDYVQAFTRNGNYQLYKGHTFWSGFLVG